MPAYDMDEARWQAVVERDLKARAAFVYAVTTTGIYCRAGCASRRPKRKNVRFFQGADAAEAAGFRPCQRCHPRDTEAPVPHSGAVLAACRLIDASDKAPTLQELADHVHLSQSQLHRLFRAQVGMTPKQYATARRNERATDALQASETVTDAAYAAGFGSSSRFYAQMRDALGMAPATYREKGKGEMICYGIAECDLGLLMVARTDSGLCAIQLGDDVAMLVDALKDRFKHAGRIEPDEQMGDVLAQVVEFVNRPEKGLDLPLDIQGTAFQQRVWQALRQIPLGETATYSEVARAIGQPKATRAVASACGANKLAVVIPCHRVVRTDGGLGGYRWGIERKRALLARERAADSNS